MKNATFVLVIALFALVFAGCLMGTPAITPTPLADGSVDPLEGTPCIAGAIQACDYPCWSAALRVCPAETMRWTRCTPDELHGNDTCAPAPCTDPAVCSTVCGNAGLRACDLATGLLGACDPIFPPGEICDAGVMPADAGTDAGPLPIDAGTDAGPEDLGPPDLGPPDLGPPVMIDAGVDAGPLMCGGCTDRNATRVCETRCGFAGGQTCGECLNGLCCHPLAPSLETCALADPICMSGIDAGPVVVDAGAGADAGTDAGPSDLGPPDLGPPDLGPPDMGPPDLGPPDLGPPDLGPVDAGPPDMGPPDLGPPDLGPRDAGPPDMGPPDLGPPDLGPPDLGPPDLGPVVDAGSLPLGVLQVELDPTVAWCPSGGTLEFRNWDNTPAGGYEHFGPPPLIVPVSSTGVLLDPISVLNNTMWCSRSSATWDGYFSPVLVGATLGSLASSMGVRRVVLDGVDVTSSVRVCWDFSRSERINTTELSFLRIQIAARTGSLPTACYGSSGS